MLNTVNVSSAQKPLQLLKQPATSTTDQPAANQTPQTATSSSTSGSQVLSAMAASSTNLSTLTQQAINILKKPPFAPKNINMFTTGAYPNSTPMTPAPDKPVNVTQIKGQLTAIFNKRFNNNAEQVKNAMALFSDPAISKVIPDPRLRAALVSLKGTAGEAAIACIKSGTFSKISFKNLPAGIIGEAMGYPGQDIKPYINVNSRYKNEDFRLLASTMAHEALHSDTQIGQREELVNHSIDSLVYGQFVLEDPSLASSGTELTRRDNTKLMARLNSRDANGNLRLFQAQGSNVYPGGSSLPDFAAALQPFTGGNTPGNPTLQKMLKAVTGINVQSPNFDDRTLNLLDQHQVLFSPIDLVNLAKALKLNIGQ